MANTTDFSLNSLNTNPSFNFSNSLFNSNYFSSNPNDDTYDDSPYSNLDIQCNYMDESQYVSSFKNTKQFSYMSLNLQSLPAKFNEFHDLIQNLTSNCCSPDIILLQEIWQLHNPSSFNISNYSPIEFKCRQNNMHGGGVALYIKRNLRFNILQDKSIFIDRVFESIFAEIWLSPNKRVICGSIYRPNVNHPTLTTTEQFNQFIDLFSNLMNDFASSNTPVILFGDFNLDVLKYSMINQVTEYVDLLFSYGFLQLVMKPTRCTPNSATLIDHVISNSKSDAFETVILLSKISDHFPIIHLSKNLKIQTSQKPLIYRNFSPLNIKSFSDALDLINWNVLSSINDTQSRYDYFSDTFFSLYDLYFPLISKIFNKNINCINPWMTKGLLISRRNKNFLAKQCIQNPSEPFISKYKTYRNLYAKTIKAGKKLYFQKQFSKYQSDCKKTWEIIRKAINNSCKRDNSIQNIIYEGTFINDPSVMAEKFNNFFAKIATEIVQKINPVRNVDNLPVSNTHLAPTFKFVNNPLRRSEIADAISQLKNKPTLDDNGISSAFVKNISHNLIEPLFHIFDESFRSGDIPHQMKIAKVIPLFKSGSR